MSGPLVSVIIPVRNARRTVEDCIRSVLETTYPRSQVEVLVVDNGSSDGSAEILRRFAGEVRILYERRRGSAAARNTGLRNARGGIVAFTDADCSVHSTWLEELVAPLRAPEVGITGGRILAKRPCNAVEAFGEHVHDHRMAIQRFDPPYVITMNWASPMRVLAQAGFFDETFRRGQDTDLAWRIVQLGYRLVFAPRAIVYHQNERNLLGLFREGYVHGFHSRRLREKHATFLRERGRLKPLEFRTDLAEMLGQDRRGRTLYWGTFNLGKRTGQTLATWRASTAALPVVGSVRRQTPSRRAPLPSPTLEEKSST